MLPICEHSDPGALEILIDGPTINGEFFIRNRRGDVWDGRRWRGVGLPKGYLQFMPAFREALKLKRVRK